MVVKSELRNEAINVKSDRPSDMGERERNLF